MYKLLERFFSVNNMIPSDKVEGDIPETKYVYNKAFNVAWPSAIEAVLVALIASVDTMMVGTVGPEAIAAVGITNQPKFILLAIIFSLNVGVTAIVARRKGQRDREGANRCLRQALVICLCLSTILSVLGFIYARPLLKFAGAGEDIIDNAVGYFRLIATGNIFTSLNLTVNAAQRGIGNTRISMRTNIVANVINLIFNYLLIGGNFGFPRLEVIGAGIATMLGNIIACIISITTIVKADGFLHISIKQNWKLDKDTVGSIVNISSSSLVEQICMRVGFFTTNKLVAGLGTIAFATHQICMNITSISFNFGDGLGIAASSLVGQSLGEKRPDMASIYSKSLQKIVFVISLILMTLFIIFRFGLIDLFTDEREIIIMGATIMLIIAGMVPFHMRNVVITGSLRGAGDTKFVARTSLICIGLIRPFTTWLFCYPLGFGIMGAWFSFCTDQLLRLLINSFRFKSGNWTKIKI